VIAYTQNHIKKTLLIGLTLFIGNSSIAQDKKEFKDKYETHFGFQGKVLLPNNFISSKTVNMINQSFEVNMTETNGVAYGAIIRKTYNEKFSIETGLNYYFRNFSFVSTVKDSNASATGNFTFTNFEVPLYGFVFIKLSNEVYANTALGLNFNYKPSAVESAEIANNQKFTNRGIPLSSFGLDVAAQFGFEYRTRRSGMFYLGGNVKVPLTPLFNILSIYQKGGNAIKMAGKYQGSLFSIDLRYYFPEIKNKGSQPLQGPIE
jgi:hypothetical protein